MNLLRTPILILLFTALAIFAFFYFLGKNEEKISHIRNHSNFYGVKIIGSFDSEIIIDKDFKVELEGDENFFDNVKSEVSEGNLVIYSEKKYGIPEKRTKIKIVIPELKSLSLSGNSNSQVLNVQSDKLTIVLNGTSNAKINGEVMDLNLTANGESRFDAEKLQTQNAKCKLHGASIATIYVSEKLDVEAFGASSLEYIGSPKKITQNLKGSSSINTIK